MDAEIRKSGKTNEEHKKSDIRHLTWRIISVMAIVLLVVSGVSYVLATKELLDKFHMPFVAPIFMSMVGKDGHLKLSSFLFYVVIIELTFMAPRIIYRLTKNDLVSLVACQIPLLIWAELIVISFLKTGMNDEIPLLALVGIVHMSIVLLDYVGRMFSQEKYERELEELEEEWE